MKTVNLQLTLSEPMLGTVPKDKEVYASYITTKDKEMNPQKALDELETVEEIEERGWTGFHQDEDGLFIFDYMIKGFLKEAGNTIKDTLKIKNLKSKIENYVFVFPRRIHLGKENPDGVLERPLRAMTMQGPRVSLARSDYVSENTTFKVELKLLENKEITQETLSKILEYGALKGLGQWRNGSWGRFSFEFLP